jgi:hypothetical protein
LTVDEHYEEAFGELAAYLSKESGETLGFCRDELAAKLEAALLCCRKQHDYGPDNINACGMAGIAVRLTDKVARLRTLVLGDREPNNESVRDTLLDIGNYGSIGLRLIDGTWPGGKRADG